MSGKDFRFSLQKVLDLRRHETERARHALRAARSEREKGEARLEAARAQRARRQRAGAEKKARRPASLRQDDAYRREARQAVTDAREALSACRTRVEEAQEALRERRRAEEALEKLRERERAEHDREQSRAEIAFLDEQAVLRHSRSASSPLTSPTAR